MSKHLGNTVFLNDALNKWTSDTVRLYLLHGSNQWRDFDWRNEDCNIYKRHLERFYNLISEIMKVEITTDDVMNVWLRTVINQSIREVKDFLEKGEVRKAVDTAFFGIWNEIDWYRRRTNGKGVSNEHVKTWLKLLAPFIPHVCEEIWHNLGETEFISLEDWPILDEKGIDKKVVQLEETLKRTIDDVKHISELTGRKDNLYLYTVSDNEYKHFVLAKEFLQKELGLIKVEVFMAEDRERYDPENKARRALLWKSGIYLE
jgi:leucyl-tRNA synthetase